MENPREITSIANRLKGLRKMSNISAEDIAAALNISVDEYRTYEEGNTDFTFSLLYKCANFFHVDVKEILTGRAPHLETYTVCRNGKGMPIKRREGFEYRHLASALKDRMGEPCVVKVDYSKDLDNSPINLTYHVGQELDYVLEGTLKIQVGDHIEILEEGDSIYFDASKHHGMVATGGKACKFLIIGVRGTASEEESSAFTIPALAEDVVMNTKDRLLYKKFVSETLNNHGQLVDINFNIPEDFNFGFDVVDAIANKSPYRTAMVWESSKHDVRAFTFSDISRNSSQAANYFKSLGIKKGDKVMLILKRHHEFWTALVGLHKIGAVAIPATNLLTTKDLVYRFNSAGVKAIICTADGDVSHFVDDSLSQSPSVEIKIIVNGTRLGWLNFTEGTRAMPSSFDRPTGEEAIHKHDDMLMYFTSGTTGYPKIATHDFTYPLGHIVTARWWHNVNPDGLHFAVSDTGWGKAVWGKIYGQWLCESAIFTYDFDRFNSDDILKMFAKHRITTFCAPPTMFRMFIKENLSKYDLSSLEYCCIAGEALNPEVFYQFQKETGIKMMEGFGQTETTLTIANLVHTEPKPGSMGKPNPQYDVLIVDPDNNPVKTGDVGEIVISTKKGRPCGMFKYYYKNEETTNKAWYDGLYHTGDTAWCDEDGYYWYVGRTDDIIKSSGYRIGPFEIESVLMELPYVLECAVVGVPDPVRGQVVKAFIVPTAGMETTQQLKLEIQNYVKDRTAPYKYPRVVEFLDELPKTISGKIRRVDLRSSESGKEHSIPVHKEEIHGRPSVGRHAWKQPKK